MTTIIKRNEEMNLVFEEITKIVQKHNLPSRCEFPLVDAAYGLRINRPWYVNETSVTEFVASRDLRRLSDLELLEPHGEKRGRYYLGSSSLRQMRQGLRDNSPMPDPYKLADTQRAVMQARRQPALPGIS